MCSVCKVKKKLLIPFNNTFVFNYIYYLCRYAKTPAPMASCQSL